MENIIFMEIHIFHGKYLFSLENKYCIRSEFKITNVEKRKFTNKLNMSI